jgi:hypothetical protein
VNVFFGSMTPIRSQAPIRRMAAAAATTAGQAATRSQILNLGLLRHFQGVVDLDPEVPHRAFKLGMA